ncbi:hypothetical protein AOPFMNJM_1513 [Methylobacterium jeotgali]|uniref:Secreted protein n=1 Tax=Methylobacterium jeotgali TaxID=381630 RepID=A0ABQ4SUP4_9HYPH|nr:hypothetical protein AOPFMNJM_1513 [Methylobacterium jeotgali]
MTVALSISATVGAVVKSFVATASSARPSACVSPVAVGASLTGVTVIETVPAGLTPWGPFWPSSTTTAIEVVPW